MAAKSAKILRHIEHGHTCPRECLAHLRLVFATRWDTTHLYPGIDKDLWSIGEREESISAENTSLSCMSCFFCTIDRHLSRLNCGRATAHTDQAAILDKGNFIATVEGCVSRSPGQDQVSGIFLVRLGAVYFKFLKIQNPPGGGLS